MYLSEVREELDLELLAGSDSAEVTGGYTSDLLSDVMAHAEEGDVIITIQAHTNTVAVATNVEAPAIIICNARPVPEEMLASAREHGVALWRTGLNQFQVSGRLYPRFG
ncbi:MAG: hypothetical protein ACOC2D_19205 [Spirochaetota bacterium]